MNTETQTQEQEMKTISISPPPAVVLSNKLRVVNFSSPHSFEFVDGNVLPACDAMRCQFLSAEPQEREESHPGGWTDICLSFKLGKACFDELQALEGNPAIDVILVPLPILAAAKEEGLRFKKIRTLRMADRVAKKLHIDRFCV